MFLIGSRFSPAEQGYYYTFASILGVQALLDLGLGAVIVQFASFEWATLTLRDSRIEGPEHQRARLGSLFRFATKWYLGAAGASAVALSMAGLLFFSHSPAEAAWRGPWLALCVASSLQLALLPVFSVLEGCHQLTEVYRYRLSSAVAGSLATWVSVASGAGLWAAPVTVAVMVGVGVMFMVLRFRSFLSALRVLPRSSVLHWRREVLPLQWRVAVSWLTGYVVFQLYTPFAFKVWGSAAAGRVGMTWALVTAVIAVAYTWTATKIPAMGSLIARREFHALDALFRRTTILSVAVSLLGGGAVAVFVLALDAADHSFSQRLLPLGPTVILLLGGTVVVACWALTAYARAHQVEPFLAASIIGALVTPALALPLSRTWNFYGLATAFALAWIVQIGLILRVFVKRRGEWRSRRAIDEASPDHQIVATETLFEDMPLGDRSAGR